MKITCRILKTPNTTAPLRRGARHPGAPHHVPSRLIISKIKGGQNDLPLCAPDQPKAPQGCRFVVINDTDSFTFLTRRLQSNIVQRSAFQQRRRQAAAENKQNGSCPGQYDHLEQWGHLPAKLVFFLTGLIVEEQYFRCIRILFMEY